MELRKTPLDESLWLYEEPALFEAISPQKAMDLASCVALKGVGAVHKNPMVGAVLVDADHRFLAAAAHLAFGQEHAELNLLEEINKRGLAARLAQSTLYVTLEPCSHYGKTPPCVDAIIKVPIKEEVYGAIDPNPLGSGRGIALLEEHGILCTFSSEFARMAEHLLEHFSWCLSYRTPFIGLKAALTLNGMAAHEGDRRVWITGERARNYGHWLRCQYEAILVGAQTMALDNPTLNVRHPKIRGRTPLRIILDPKGRALQSRNLCEHKVLQQEAEQTLWVCEDVFWLSPTGTRLAEDLPRQGAQILGLADNWTLATFLQQLGDKDLASLLVEGGPQTWGAFLNARLVNKVHCFMASKLLARDSVNMTAAWLGEDLTLEQTTVTVLDDDLLIEGRLTL